MRAREFITEALLLEDKIQYIASQLGDRILAAAGLDQSHVFHNDPEAIVRHISKWVGMKYLQWAVNRFVAGEYELIDLVELQEDLTEFVKISQSLPQEQRDLNKIKSLDGLRAILKPFADIEIKSKKQKEREMKQALYDNGEIEVYYKDNGLTILIPKTMKAAIYIGRGTEWCTAYTEAPNQFHEYNNGPLYTIITKKLGKMQFHFQNNEFKDAQNKTLDSGAWRDLVTEYPQLVDIFKKQARDYFAFNLLPSGQYVNWHSIIEKAVPAIMALVGPDLKKIVKKLTARSELFDKVMGSPEAKKLLIKDVTSFKMGHKLAETAKHVMSGNVYVDAAYLSLLRYFMWNTKSFTYLTERGSVSEVKAFYKELARSIADEFGDYENPNNRIIMILKEFAKMAMQS